ncbi:MAG: VOC family protein [Pseudomonadota bacterium]
MNDICEYYGKLDHIAIAVNDLESAVKFYQNILGFKLVERRKTTGHATSMISAVMGTGKDSSFTIVLIEGCEEASQVSRFIKEFGYGVQHVAIKVEDIDVVAKKLTEQGVQWATDLIDGGKLKQIFTKRCEKSGVMYEFIERCENGNAFDDKNVNNLFSQLENSDSF